MQEAVPCCWKLAGMPDAGQSLGPRIDLGATHEPERQRRWKRKGMLMCRRRLEHTGQGPGKPGKGKGKGKGTWGGQAQEGVGDFGKTKGKPAEK